MLIESEDHLLLPDANKRDVRARRQLIVGVDPMATPAAPTLDGKISPPAQAPAATWTGDTQIFSGNQVQYGFIFYDPNYGYGTDITAGDSIDFASAGDGSAVITNIPALPDTAPDMQVWLVRLDSNVGSWELVADVTGQTEYTDQGGNSGYWYGDSSVYFQYAIGFQRGSAFSQIGDNASDYNYWFAQRRLSNFPATPAGATRWLLRYDSWNSGQWIMVADVTAVSEYVDSNEDAYTSGNGYWNEYDPGAQTIAPGGLVQSVNGSTPDPSTGDVSISVAVNDSTFSGQLSIAHGGTGASTQAGARTNFGLGTMATQAASAVAITGGTATLTSISVPGTGTNSQQFGANATTNGKNNSLAIGYGATITSSDTYGQGMAVGFNAQAYSHNAVALGPSAVASAADTFAFGYGALCSGAFGMALGNGTQSTGGGLALGYFAAASAANAIAIGAPGAAHVNTCVVGNYGTSEAGGQFVWCSQNVTTPDFQMTNNNTGVSSRRMSSLKASWVSSTDASRKSRVTLSAFDAAGTREGLRVEASGSAPMISVYGANAVAKQTVTGSRGGNAALADLLTKLANLGFITDSTTA